MKTARHYARAGAALVALALVVIKSAYGRTDLITAGQIYVVGIVTLGVGLLALLHAHEMRQDMKTRSRANHPTNHRTH